MSLIQRKLSGEAERKISAERRVEEAQALHPSTEEIKNSDLLIKNVSSIFNKRISEEGLTETVKLAIVERVEYEINQFTSNYEERSRLKKITLSAMFGLGPLEVYMIPGSKVTDIIVQKYNHICIEDDTGVYRVEAEFNSEEHLRNVISRIVQQVGRQINLACPAVDAKLEDGSRIHATLPPISPDGATLTIRRFNTRKLDAEDYLELETLNQEMLDFLVECVQKKISILVCGGTGSGKTTLLNMLSGFIPDDELIVTIEDNCELQLKQPNVRRMEARSSINEASGFSIQDLVKHSLRMRPDRIIVGEVRDGSVVDMLSAMSTGHEGSMSTIHTNSPRALVDSRLPTLFSMYGTAFTKETQSLMTAEAVQLIVQISREPNRKRKITYITSVEGYNEQTGLLELVDIYRYSRENDESYRTDENPDHLIKTMKERGYSLDTLLKYAGSTL